MSATMVHGACCIGGIASWPRGPTQNAVLRKSARPRDRNAQDCNEIRRPGRMAVLMLLWK